jgi:importin subunit alpha-1
LRREATWALCNAIVGSTNDQVCDIVDEDVIDALVAMARVDDTTMVVLALDALNRVLTVGAEMGEVEDYLSDWFAEREGPEMLQELLDTEQLEIYQRVDEILSHFFEDADDENGEENDDEEEGA